MKAQVQAFKSTVEEILKKLVSEDGKRETGEEESPIAKLAEEMKTLPARVAERLSEFGDPFRKRRFRRFHPMMMEEILHMTEDPSDPVGILILTSLIRDDAPWLYELTMEVYRAAKSGDPTKIRKETSRLHRCSSLMMRGPLAEELGLGFKDAHMFYMEFPRMLEQMLEHSLAEGKPIKRTRSAPGSE